MRPAILFFCTLILSACASVDNSKKVITLESATRQYEKAIRWGEYQAANSLRRGQAGSAADATRLKAVRVTAYEPVRTVEFADGTGVQIDVEIRYYNEFTMKEVTIIDPQSWEYDPEGKSWYITSPMPSFE